MPVLVNQYSVMLSSRSSRVSALSRVPCRTCSDEARLTAPVAVVEHERRQVDGRVGQPIQGLRARRHELRVGDVLGEERAELLVGERSSADRSLGGGSPRWTAVMIAAGTVPAMFEWIPTRSGRGLFTHRLGDRRTPVAALGHEPL